MLQLATLFAHACNCFVILAKCLRYQVGYIAVVVIKYGRT